MATKPSRAQIVAAVTFCSVALVGFLGKWEGEKEFTVYADRLSGGLPTVCRGLTRHVTSTTITVGDVWSAEKCEREELAAINRQQHALIQCFQLAPPQSVFDAASSHAWNLGVSATCNSAAMAAWNRGDWALGCRRLQFGDDGRPVWSYRKTGRTVNGIAEYEFVRGLANRRADEVRLCAGK